MGPIITYFPHAYKMLRQWSTNIILELLLELLRRTNILIKQQQQQQQQEQHEYQGSLRETRSLNSAAVLT